MVSSRDSKGEDLRAGNLDPYALQALFQALTGRKGERQSMSSTSIEDWNEIRRTLDDNDDNNDGGNGGDDNGRDRNRDRDLPRPDERPRDLRVGAINPYALVEAMIGRRLDQRSINATKIMSDVLQTDYDELFDLRHKSVLFAGVTLNEKDRTAEKLDEKDLRILHERDLETPDFSRVTRVEDLEKIGLKDMAQARVKMARMQNGKLRLVINAHQLGRTVSNKEITRSLNELCLPFRRGENGRRWTPPNSQWRDINEVLEDDGTQRRRINNVENFRLGRGCNNNMNKFDDPIQGAAPNSWLIAAIFSVFWADPCQINRNTRIRGGHRRNDNGDNGGGCNDENRRQRTLSVRLHDKGGRNNNQTATMEVTYDIPVNNSSNDPVYCRSSDGIQIWPALYEKAFAMWVTGDTNNDRPDITQTAHGDPIKAMAQINNREPLYYYTDKHSAHDLVGVVRASSVNYKTINPMCAYTHASGRVYRGCNLVANHAYSVCGWASAGERQYIILRNPWGVTEPEGLTSYPGLINRVEPQFWRPACLLDQEGVMALEMNAFKEYFACIGVAK